MLAQWAARTFLAVAVSGSANMVHSCEAALNTCERIEEIRSAKEENNSGNPSAALKQIIATQSLGGLDGNATIFLLGQKATAYAMLGVDEQSIAAISSALSLEPNDVWLLIRSCQQHAMSGYIAKAQRDCLRARTLLRRGVQSNTASGIKPHLYYSESVLAIQSGRPDLALERLNDEVFETFPSAYVDDLRASAFFALARYKEAESAITRVLSSDLHDDPRIRSELLHRRGFVRLLQGGVDDGIQDLEAAIEAAHLVARDPNVASDDLRLEQRLSELSYSLCAVHLRLNAWKAALKSCQSLSETGFGHARHEYLDALGVAQIQNDLFVKAAGTLGRALELNPRSISTAAKLRFAVAEANSLGAGLRLEDFATASNLHVLEPIK